MAKRYFALAMAALLTAGLASVADAGNTKLTREVLVPLGQQGVFDDQPVQRSSMVVDTTFYGGFTAGFANTSTIASEAIWDFEDNTLQGWTSIDQTDIGVFVRRVEAADFTGLNGSDSGLMTGGGSTASLWFGGFEEESLLGCWPGGMGYSNGWGQTATKTLTYSGTGDVNVTFNYFIDAETQFDFTYVYIYAPVTDTKSAPQNTSAWSNPDTGLGYSGGGFEGTAIGSPTAPATDSITIDEGVFGGNSGSYRLQLDFDSDPLYSDGLDSFSAGFYDSQFGPAGFDNITVQGSMEGDFENGDDGWLFDSAPAIGKLMQVARLSERGGDLLDPIADACECPITADPSNEFVLVCADITTSLPHPQKQHEEMISPPGVVSDPSHNNIGMLWSAWADNPFDAGIGYRRGFHYFPWTCPETGTAGWTLELAGPGGYTFTDPAACGRFIQDFSTYWASGTEQIKCVIDILGDCDDFGVDECLPVEQTNQTPYLDDIQLFTFGAANAPSLSLVHTFSDRFPTSNTLSPSATVEVKTWYDNNRADSDLSNANMGDSAVVNAGIQAGTRVFLNFRVYPGPATNTADPFFTLHGDALAPSWGKARMDSAEDLAGNVADGFYVSYVWPNGTEGFTGANKIMQDGVLTPGSQVEYFFSADFGAGQPEDTNPDTTGGFFLEWEALPGYFNAGGGNILGPCVLYVDAFNNGGQVPIELYGLTPNLGQDVTGGDLWDRYDYVAAGGNTPAPLARETDAIADNGMTKFQSLFYSTILYNTGTNLNEGLRDGDADLLIDWLLNTDFGRPDVNKGLWLSGNGMADILDKPGRPDANSLLTAYAGAVLTDAIYRDEAVGGPDSSFCVRLDPTVGRNFGAGSPYSAITRNGCPDLESFNVISPVGPGNADQVYVNQDDGGDITPYASISNDQWDAGSGRYGVVIDAYSLHFLRSVAPDFSTDDCAVVEDSTAIGDRMADVFAWMNVPAGGAAICDLDLLGSVSTPPSTSPIAKTVLFQNTPNPFNPRTTVRYQIAEEAHVTLQIFDVTGKLVKTLVDGVQVPEAYNIVWDGSTDAGSAVSSGVYWARLATSRGFKASTKMVVLK